jgi:Relaxase/Mobilisation nuclease domain.
MRSCHVKERLTPAHTNYVRKLCGMANNLNQIAHKANAAGFVTVRVECRVLVARIEELLNLIFLW